MWLKIKIWSKVAVGAIVGLYVLLFLFNNWSSTAEFWWWFGTGREYPLLGLVFFSFVFGVILTLVTRMVWGTVKQLRESRARQRTQQMEKDVEQMKQKAGMLQQKKPTGGA